MTLDNNSANDLFEPEGNDPAALFSEESNDPDKDFVAELVGEGKKFKDTNALAKSVLYKDAHILKIESENAQQRQELAKRLSLEEFYDKIKTPTPSPSTPLEPIQDEPDRTVSIEQINALVGQKLKEHLTEAQQKDNLARVQVELERRLGPNFKRLMKDRAQEVGETPEALVTLAMNKPKLFLELMVPAITQTNMPGLPRTQIDTGKMGSSQHTVRDSNWYANLRRTDKAKYESRDVQIQMHKDAQALGEKFFQ